MNTALLHFAANPWHVWYQGKAWLAPSTGHINYPIWVNACNDGACKKSWQLLYTHSLSINSSFPKPLTSTTICSGIARGGQEGARAPGATLGGRWNDVWNKKWHKEKKVTVVVVDFWSKREWNCIFKAYQIQNFFRGKGALPLATATIVFNHVFS